jgi:putative intracellular protease/amidase
MADMIAHLYVFDGFADWEAAFAVTGINNPQFQRHPGRWEVRTVSEEPRVMVRSMGGVAVLPDTFFGELLPEDSDLLILPGGPGWEEEGPHDQALHAAVELAARAVPVAAICGATAGLARVGLLDERAHTSNAQSYINGTGYAGQSHYVDEPAVNADGVITAGGMAPLEFAREIFRQLDLYEDEALHAWYELYKTGKSEHFARLRRAAQATADA